MARSWKAALGALALATGTSSLAAQPMPSQAGMYGPGMGPMSPSMGGDYGPEEGGGGFPEGIMDGPGGACFNTQGGCCEDDCCPPRGWYVRGEALALTRTTAADHLMIYDQNGLGGEIFNSGQLDLDHTVTPRITLGKQLSDCYALEAVYFGMLHQQASFSLVAADTGSLFYSSPWDDAGGFNFFSGNGFSAFTQQDISYESDLHNVEINLKINRGNGFWGSRRSSLIGVRYIALYERLNMSSTPLNPGANPTAVYRIDTFNNLVGPQLGTDWSFGLCDRLAVNVWGKAGLFANIDAQKSNIVDDFGGAYSTQRHRTQLAGLIEVGVLGELAIKRNWSLFGGYQVYHLSGVALAPDQIDYMNSPTSQTYLNDKASVTYHGPSAGLEVRW